MKTTNIKREKRIRLKRKIRSRVSGTAACPRLSVFRSNTAVYAQLIDDASGVTLVSASDMKDVKGSKRERAEAVGTMVAKRAQEKGITRVVFDRGGFRYTGRVKALADAARKGGLIF